MLTYMQEKQIKDGGVKPLSIDLLILIELALNRYMAKFRVEMKTIPEFNEENPPVSINKKAVQYHSQILGMISQVSKEDDLNRTVKKIKRAFIAILGISVNWDQINGASQEGWEDFIDSKMDEIFEQLARTTKEGKAEYEAIIE